MSFVDELIQKYSSGILPPKSDVPEVDIKNSPLPSIPKEEEVARLLEDWQNKIDERAKKPKVEKLVPDVPVPFSNDEMEEMDLKHELSGKNAPRLLMDLDLLSQRYRSEEEAEKQSNQLSTEMPTVKPTVANRLDNLIVLCDKYYHLSKL